MVTGQRREVWDVGADVPSCYGCAHGDHLDRDDVKQAGYQMFCRKKWEPIMYKEYESCDLFQPYRRVGSITYMGGGCSGK